MHLPCRLLATAALALLSLGMHCHRPIHQAVPFDPANHDQTKRPVYSDFQVLVLSRGSRPVSIGDRDTPAAQIAIEAQEPWLLVTAPAQSSGIRFRWTDLTDAQPGVPLATGAQLLRRSAGADRVSLTPQNPVHVFLVRPEANAAPRRDVTARVLVKRPRASEFTAAPLSWNPAPSQCGNEIVEPDETCDDGNLTPGDGCDSCAIESVVCDDQRPGTVRYWHCAGLPNRCAEKICDPAVGDCPSSLPTKHTIAVSIVETGAVTNAGANAVESTPPGIACTCTETFSGRTCSDTCAAEFPVCTPVRLTARRPDATRFSGWIGACSGGDSTCVIEPAAKNIDKNGKKPGADSVLTAYFGAPAPVTRAVSLPTEAWGQARMWMAKDGRMVVSTSYDATVQVGGHRLVAPDGPRYYAAELSFDGSIRRAWDLGSKDRIIPLGAALDSRGVWVATAEGDLQNYARAPRPKLHPRYHIRRYERGALAFNRRFPYYMGERASVQTKADGGALVTLAPSRRQKNDGWRIGGATAILWIQPDGSVQRRWEMATEVWSSTRAVRLLPSGRVVAAGLFDGRVAAKSPLQPLENDRTDGMYRIEVSADGKTETSRSQALLQDSRGAMAIDASGTINHVQALYRPRMWQLIRWSKAAASTAGRKTDSTCYRADTANLVAIDDRTGRIAVAELECAPLAQRPQSRGLAIHSFSADGAHLRTWRFGGPAAHVEFGDIAFATHGQSAGQIVVAARVRGTVTLGRRTVRGHDQRLLLVWLPPAG